MDDFDVKITHILTLIAESSLSDTEKADIYVQLNVGMRRLVWPILLSHIPQYELDDMIKDPNTMTMERYVTCIQSTLQNPATPKEIHDEILGALGEVEALLVKRLPKPPAPAS